jgi:CheY-like chemotaxis protein
VLVVDDDRRVRELLEITLTTQGFAVLTAADGEEALMRARRERPDLILLDVRLPKRSGLEVCDVLRNDPTDPAVPIILITGAAEVEHRLQGFGRGADDVLGKPFSPKELVARMRRLLARAGETRASVRRALELERELASAKREARRADDEARREEMLRAAAAGPGCELLGMLDEDALLARLLVLTQLKLRARAVVALVADRPLGPLHARLLRGDGFERVARLTLPGDGECASLLRGLARPVRRADLDGLSDLTRELAPLVTGRWDLIVPLVASGELEAVLLAEEPGVLGTGAKPVWDELAVIGGFAAVALGNAREVRAQARWLLAAAAERAHRSADASTALVEARRLLDGCGRSLGLTPSERERARHALALAEWARTEDGRRELDNLCSSDASGLVRGVRTLIDAAWAAPGSDPERSAVLLAAADAYRASRARGAGVEQALARARSKAGSDPFVAETLAASAGLVLDPERDAA